MKTGTTEEWKKVVPKSRRKASPISKKTGTISYNPKQKGSKTEIYKLKSPRDHLLPRAKISLTRQTLQALQLESKKRQQKQNPPIQSPQKHMDHRAQVPRVQQYKHLKIKYCTPKPTPKCDDMEGVTSSRLNKHHKAPKGVQYLFITIAELSGISTIGDTIKSSPPTWESNIATKTMVRSSEWGLPSK